MASDFALSLRRFLTAYLAGLRGCSPNTVASYRDTFKLLVVFFRDDRSIPPEKLTLDCIDAEAIVGFLDWLCDVRHNSVSTRNQRLAAIASFFRWMHAIPRPCPDGRLPGHSRHPNEETAPTGGEPPEQRADPARACCARPIHPVGTA